MPESRPSRVMRTVVHATGRGPPRGVPAASEEGEGGGKGKDKDKERVKRAEARARTVAGVLGRVVLLLLFGASLFALTRGRGQSGASMTGAWGRAPSPGSGEDSLRGSHGTDASLDMRESLRGRLCPGGRPDVEAARTLFVRAQELLGVAGGVESREARARTVPLKWFSFAPGAYTLPNQRRAVFFYTWKCGSHASRKFMEALAESLGDTGVDGVPVGGDVGGKDGKDGAGGPWEGWGCKVMVTRDPLSHFTSGVNEWEYRAARSEDETLKEPRFLDAHRERMAFAQVPLGDPRRFDLFVAELLRPGSLLMDAPGIEHTFPTAGVLTRLSAGGRAKTAAGRYRRVAPGLRPSTPLDVTHVDVANLTLGLPAAFRACPSIPPARVPPAVPALPDGGHASNKDPHGTYAAARTAIKASFAADEGQPATGKALCLALAIDYACFGYPWPPFCEGLVLDTLLQYDGAPHFA